MYDLRCQAMIYSIAGRECVWTNLLVSSLADERKQYVYNMCVDFITRVHCGWISLKSVLTFDVSAPLDYWTLDQFVVYKPILKDLWRLSS